MNTNEFRPIQTANKDSSIWKDLSEDEFRTHLVSLEKLTNAVPVDVQVFEIDEAIHDQCLLPVKVEQRIADDFAFLAAVQEGAQSVAAVCLEQHFTSTASLTIKLAAVDTLDERTRATLEAICNILKHVCARTDAVDELFNLIIAQHQSRILARIRSNKWKKPRYLAASHKKPLWQDFANLIHRAQHIYPSKKEKASRDQVERELCRLASVYQSFEAYNHDRLQDGIKYLVRTTYDLCRDPSIRSFAAEIQTLRPTMQIAAAVKTLHQLEKIGAYFRIAKDLVNTATDHPHWFGNIILNYLTPFASVPTSIAYEPWATTCHIHAEIQLVVHYDLLKQKGEFSNHHTGIYRPRAIGTSKYLCFLCYLFIKHHGQFFAANTHGRLYDQWTVPDLKDYNEDLRVKYASVLKEIDREVLAMSDDCGPNGRWRVEPMTSRQNLLL